jgi:hypothetical protein
MSTVHCGGSAQPMIELLADACDATRGEVAALGAEIVCLL